MKDGGDSVDSVPLFPSEPGVPRRRRTSDVVRLVVAGTVFVLLGWAASGDPESDARIAEFLTELPSWIRTLAWVGFTGSAIAALALVVAAIVSRQERRAVVRDLPAMRTCTACRFSACTASSSSRRRRVGR